MSYLHVASGEPASVAGLAGLGKAPAPRLSSGQYGLAMSRIAVPADAIRLLRLSPTFKRMAGVLDKAYVDHLRFDALQKRNPRLTLDKDFRITGSASLRGRRVLYVGYGDAGSLFVPGQSIESPAGWDIILISAALGSSDPLPWVQAIAHETAHAVARVSARGAAPRTAVRRVQAAVLDECNTRKREHEVLAEIRATSAGKKALAQHPVPGPVRTCDCERDWFPVRQKRTYLEQFVLGMDWESAAQPLSDAEQKKIATDVAAIPLVFSSKQKPPPMAIAILRGTASVASYATQFPVLKSPAGQAAFVLRLVDASWRQLIAKIGEGSSTWTGGAHQLRLERHARVFFKINIGYTQCP